MTAQNIIDSSKPVLTGLKISEDDTTLLSFLNLAKNQIAQDTLLWIDGEEITMTDSYVYTLDTIPIQIIDMYDESMQIRPRNKATNLGYFQVSPNSIRMVSIDEGAKLYVNYYYTPDDYILADEVVIPNSLINAMQYFIAHKSFEIYKSEKEMFSSTEYYKKYKSSILEYIATTDNNIETVLENDMIINKGLV